MKKAGSIWDSVGGTPLIKIKSLSELTGCEIFGKAEFLNPAGSIKDRTAKGILRAAERDHKIGLGSTIVEGTAGNTGIALATLAKERGYKVVIAMFNNQSQEKFEILTALGADVRALPPCPFANSNHFYHQARVIAEQTPGAFWANQFENLANSQIHYDETGPEIWEQLDGKVDVLTLASGTGGTIGGVSAYLKEKSKNMQVIVADPMGSGIFSYIKKGEVVGEGSSITEGIGIMRLTENFKRGKYDDAIRITDQQMIEMLHHVAREDGLILGTSAALNLRSAFEIAMKNKGKGLRIVTFLCDHGSRYFSRIFNQEWLKEKGLDPQRPLISK